MGMGGHNLVIGKVWATHRQNPLTAQERIDVVQEDLQIGQRD